MGPNRELSGGAPYGISPQHKAGRCAPLFFCSRSVMFRRGILKPRLCISRQTPAQFSHRRVDCLIGTGSKAPFLVIRQAYSGRGPPVANPRTLSHATQGKTKRTSTTNANRRTGIGSLRGCAVNCPEGVRPCRRSPAGLQVKERDLTEYRSEHRSSGYRSERFWVSFIGLRKRLPGSFYTKFGPPRIHPTPQ